VGLERDSGDSCSEDPTERVTIPHGGLGTKLAFREETNPKVSPSHTVGLEHTYYRWLKTLMKKSPSHAVGSELRSFSKGRSGR